MKYYFVSPDMNIFYAPPQQITDQTIELTDQEAHHASHVLRYKTGDTIAVVDGIGNRYEGIITKVTKKNVEISITNKTVIENNTGSERQLVVALGIIKNRQRLEFAIEKAVELGASKLVLFNSRYTEKAKVRLDRLNGIVISAMKQSMHATLPELRYEKSLKNVLENFKDYRFLMAHEKTAGTAGLPDITGNNKLLLLVGPEGGFSDEEVDFVKKNGGELVSLGRYRLRAETAVVAFLSLFLDK